jgi:uncharacterized membrane protein YoaT (DUF817 family)
VQHARWAALRLTRSSYILMSTFLATILIIGVVWWPLVRDLISMIEPDRPIWAQLDWLLLGIFAGMSILIMAGADLRADARIILVGLAGGLTIESWGTQTRLWTYFTLERPPLWIIPAWPIASLAIDRIVRLLDQTAPKSRPRLTFLLYAIVFTFFCTLMLDFAWPTRTQSLTLASLGLVTFLVVTPTEPRTALLTFAAGSALGYFLELWGTTRACWTYYTLETPPLFAVLAHGMAAVAFWRAGLVAQALVHRIPLPRPRLSS